MAAVAIFLKEYDFTAAQLKVSHRCWEHEWGLSQYMREYGVLNSVEEYQWRSSFVSKVSSYKPASLQIY